MKRKENLVKTKSKIVTPVVRTKNMNENQNVKEEFKTTADNPVLLELKKEKERQERINAFIKV